MKVFRWYPRFMMLLAVCFVAMQSALVACPNCKDNFDLNSTQGGIGAAFGYTIYMMILLPIVIVVTIVIKVKRQMDAHDKTQYYRDAGNSATDSTASI